MSNKNIFESYNLLINLYGKITTRSYLRIGIGRIQSMVESDLPIMKNGDGYPVIPGSSMKGLIRSTLSRIFATINTKQEILQSLFGHSREDGKNANAENASAVFCYELVSNSNIIENRKHIQIDPETQKVKNLFDVDCVPEGMIFQGRILTLRNVPPDYLALMGLIRSLSDEGILRLGGFKSRGYGLFKLSFEKIELQFIGKSKKKLQEGFSIIFNIPIENKEYFFQVDNLNDNALLNIKFDNKTYKFKNIKIQDAPQIFGTKIIIENEDNIKEFLDFSLENLNKQIAS
ncbi:MAG: RAMP superfamily CRISPR-associated protein [Promethearchaeota archaeon]